MKKFILVAAIAFAGIVVFALGASAEGIKEGKWSMTIVTKMGGTSQEATEAMQAMENMSPEEKATMQQMIGGMGVSMNANAPGITTTITKCITNQNPVPETQENCQSTHSIQGHTVHFESVCSDGTSTGQVTYENDSMSGTINSQSAQGNATIEITGQYVGPCNEA